MYAPHIMLDAVHTTTHLDRDRKEGLYFNLGSLPNITILLHFSIDFKCLKTIDLVSDWERKYKLRQT